MYLLLKLSLSTLCIPEYNCQQIGSHQTWGPTTQICSLYQIGSNFGRKLLCRSGNFYGKCKNASLLVQPRGNHLRQKWSFSTELRTSSKFYGFDLHGKSIHDLVFNTGIFRGSVLFVKTQGNIHLKQLIKWPLNITQLCPFQGTPWRAVSWIPKQQWTNQWPLAKDRVFLLGCPPSQSPPEFRYIFSRGYRWIYSYYLEGNNPTYHPISQGCCREGGLMKATHWDSGVLGINNILSLDITLCKTTKSSPSARL